MTNPSVVKCAEKEPGGSSLAVGQGRRAGGDGQLGAGDGAKAERTELRELLGGTEAGFQHL